MIAYLYQGELECSYCGKRIPVEQAKFIGCCPLCADCYKKIHLPRGKRWKLTSKAYLRSF